MCIPLYTKHTEQDPLPDQVKAAHVILRNKFLKCVPGRKGVQKFDDPKDGSVSSNNVDAYETWKKNVLPLSTESYSTYMASLMKTQLLVCLTTKAAKATRISTIIRIKVY
jgi:hypothetical protein